MTIKKTLQIASERLCSAIVNRTPDSRIVGPKNRREVTFGSLDGQTHHRLYVYCYETTPCILRISSQFGLSRDTRPQNRNGRVEVSCLESELSVVSDWTYDLIRALETDAPVKACPVALEAAYDPANGYVWTDSAWKEYSARHCNQPVPPVREGYFTGLHQYSKIRQHPEGPQTVAEWKAVDLDYVDALATGCPYVYGTDGRVEWLVGFKAAVTDKLVEAHVGGNWADAK